MEQPTQPARFSGLQVAGIVAGAVAIAVVATLFIVKSWLFPKPFEPVTLSASEEKTLERKLDRLEQIDSRPLPKAAPPKQQQGQEEALSPERYSEEGASREINLTERELNGLLAKNTDLARKVAIDLSDDLISAKMIIPVDPDFPFLGGKTLKVRAGAELAYRDSRPVIILRGISIMGVPVPNAWLGGLKNIDLIREFGTEQGFWKAFADGVDSIKVSDGSLRIVLKE